VVLPAVLGCDATGVGVGCESVGVVVGDWITIGAGAVAEEDESEFGLGSIVSVPAVRGS
jgi:hypothetical protein